jgi:hypothetical protein
MNIIRIRDAFVAALDHRFTHEIGGYFTTANGLRFYKTSESRFLPGNTRMSIDFPPNKRYYWHTHPPTAGWWPSAEDLLRNDARHVLFTRFGTYIWSSSQKRVLADALLAVWRSFDRYMVQKTQTHWTPEVVLRRIEALANNLRLCCGLTLVFVPLFHVGSEEDVRAHVESVRRALLSV